MKNRYYYEIMYISLLKQTGSKDIPEIGWVIMSNYQLIKGINNLLRKHNCETFTKYEIEDILNS